MAGSGYGWLKWPSAALSPEKQAALQKAGGKFMEALDSAKVTAEQRLAQGAAQVRAAVETRQPRSPSAAWARRPSTRLGSSAISLRVCTWNLHGCPVDPEDDLGLWLFPENQAADLYVIGIQELVDLGPMSMLLNTDGHEERQAELEKRIEAALSSTGRRYLKVCSFGMVGLSLLSYAVDRLEHHIGEIDCDRVKTGVDGLGGNKGGLCVRFLLGSMSMCFLNVHLPSGQNKAEDRDAHLREVLAYAFQGVSRNGSSRPAKNGFHRASVFCAAEHDLTVVLGDMNSRLADLPDPAGMPRGPPEAWLLFDELLTGKLRCVRSMGFREAEVTFPPTYKYAASGDLCPSRTPAWCDRVIYRFEPPASEVAQRVLQQEVTPEVELLGYDAYMELKRTSDHRPVAASFRVSMPSQNLDLDS